MLRLIFLMITATASPTIADVWTFETPSENIQCVVGEGVNGADLECTIIEHHSAPAAPRPTNCTSDWGHSFLMFDTGPVQMICGPLNRNRDGFERAEYGVTGQFGGITCHSSRNGLECRNSDGHGFFLSRARQTVF
ncbi:DUF6636 domain-containing protein [Aliiroseovarius sp. YM-037]|uniref:DUF6636 domain-containing protein n=1 Tax=Aliiroseovarius sp. YM-037 TaxID=3341728 RepID=UPI003A807432